MAKAVKTDNGFVAIFCPGCKRRHYLAVEPSSGRSCWKFNGDLENPTFSPSLLDRTGHYVTGQPQPPNCKYCEYEKRDPDRSFKCGTCHSFIRNGMIEFLSDSTHELAGKTVSLPDVGEWSNLAARE